MGRVDSGQCNPLLGRLSSFHFPTCFLEECNNYWIVNFSMGLKYALPLFHTHMHDERGMNNQHPQDTSARMKLAHWSTQAGRSCWDPCQYCPWSLTTNSHCSPSPWVVAKTSSDGLLDNSIQLTPYWLHWLTSVSGWIQNFKCIFCVKKCFFIILSITTLSIQCHHLF